MFFLSSFLPGGVRASSMGVALVAFAAALVGLRIALELLYTGLYRYSDKVVVLMNLAHWAFWYVAVFAMLLVLARYTLRLPPAHALYFLLVAAVLPLPVIMAAASGAQGHFSYLSWSDPGVWAAIASFMYLNAYNHAIFYELMLAAALLLALGVFLSRSILRPVLLLALIYPIFVFFHGFVHVCSEECSLTVESGMPVFLFLAFYFMAVGCLWLAVFLGPELRAYARAPESVFTRQNLRRALLLFVPYLGTVLWISPHPADAALLGVAYGFLFYLVLFLRARLAEERFSALALFLCMYAGLIAAALGLYFFWGINSVVQ